MTISATTDSSAGWDRPLIEDRRALHLLSRITFGPRPGDLEKVRAMGTRAFLERQLHPERIDDSAVEARVAVLPTLSMTPSELVEAFPPPRLARAARAPEMDQASMSDPARPRSILIELGREEVWRAVYGERQLEEVMVQFWMNHFNIFAPKGADKWLVTSFERDTIRPHALGNFEGLLVATAKSPAMLFYLDNWLSAARQPSRGGAFARGRRKNGLNENYARELMELHTLGVDGGYTQEDVTEVARVFTGWTFERPRRQAGFVFDRRIHDDGEKVVLGNRIAAGGGVDDGLRVLALLAHHPSTARLISRKLCQRFVADEPPSRLVERTSQRFLDTRGDLRAVLATILDSPEFQSEAAYRCKMKSPIELMASALRALEAETDAGLPILFFIGRMGQPMLQYQAPTGFPDRAATWINPAGLLMRMKFAAALATGRIVGTTVEAERAARLLAEGRFGDEGPGRAEGSRSPQSRVALYVASPEFQRR